MKMSAYKISDNFNGVAGSKVMSPHHSHLTNGVRPSDSNNITAIGNKAWGVTGWSLEVGITGDFYGEEKLSDFLVR